MSCEHRQSCVAQVGVEIAVGDAVLLPAATGEADSRVALLQALWSEQPCDGHQRCLCRCRLFYRPKARAAPPTVPANAFPARCCT